MSWLRDITRGKTLIRGLDHVAIVVSDMDRSIEFYTAILGMKLIKDGRAEGGLAGKARIDEHALAIAELAGVARRQLHEEIVRMLAVDQRLNAVGAFARRHQQRIPIRAHERIR